MSTKTNPEKRGRGRPVAENPRTLGLLLKLTPEEMKIIERKAESSDKPKARWLRELALAV